MKIPSTKLFCMILTLTLMPFFSNGQLKKMRGNSSGLFSVGVRSTVSMFNNHSWNTFGLGTGGQFRIQIHPVINTEYFADISVSDIGGYAHREDYHIGTSFMFYPIPGNQDCSKPFKPFLETGICFDLARVIENKNPEIEYRNLSAAWPVGLGTHINLTPRFDFTIKAQYMMHLGTDMDVHRDEHGDVHVEQSNNVTLEGHLFVSITANYKLFDIWSNKGVLRKVN